MPPADVRTDLTSVQSPFRYKLNRNSLLVGTLAVATPLVLTQAACWAFERETHLSTHSNRCMHENQGQYSVMHDIAEMQIDPDVAVTDCRMQETYVQDLASPRSQQSVHGTGID